MASAEYEDGPATTGAERYVQHPSVGATWIVLERARQMTEEGWTPEHDDEHSNGALAAAALAYLRVARGDGVVSITSWPWDVSWWKPSDDPIRNLVKAGALIAAEIDRLQRAHNAQAQAQPDRADTGRRSEDG